MGDATASLTLRCRCGEVAGRVGPVGPWTVNRVVCYCADCQAFARHLSRADLLDGKGGSDIAQVPPAAVTIEKGRARIAGLRLKPGGLHRWYSTCCNTPLGNTVSPGVPFIGLTVATLRASDDGAPDAVIGPAAGGVHGDGAVGGAPPGTRGISARHFVRAVLRVLFWRLSGRHRPHPYFDPPALPVHTLSEDARAAAYRR